MKAILLSFAFEVASRLAFAQGADDPLAHLRACSLMEHAERLECLDRLSRSIAPGARGIILVVSSKKSNPSVDVPPMPNLIAFG